MMQAVAIVIAGVLIAAAILFTNRYSIATAQTRLVWRIDRLTGQISACAGFGTNYIRCESIPEQSSK